MLKVVKIGGNVVDAPEKLDAFLCDFAAIKGEKILVHGGGKVATAIAAALGIPTTMIEGRRVTDARTLEVVTMVYNGINKLIVSKLQARGCDAVGLCGADGRLVLARKRATKPIDYGFVGDPTEVNVGFAREMLAGGRTLVVAPITMSDEGELLNTNADTIAQTMATALGADELVYCFERQGVMDVDGEVIGLIDRAKFEALKTVGTVRDGMVPKLENALRAVENGVGQVAICAAENIGKPGYGGTLISR